MKKILIVDDEEGIQVLYQEEFEEEGYQVVSARTGEEALVKFDEQRPDLVILDIQMPGINGIEVLRQMKSRDAGLPVILSSAFNEYKQDLGAWASDEYIVKSADMTALKDAVKRLINR